MNDNLDDAAYVLMRTFNWTPNQVDDIPFPIIQEIRERLKEEQREMERDRRLAERRARR